MVGTLLSTSLAAGADLKVVQDQLGHSTITLTADTYTKARELHLTGDVCPVPRLCRQSE
jgi:site-specific recombinase XerD